MEKYLDFIKNDFKQYGISFDKGLACCSDSIKIYKEILNIAIETYEEKSMRLKRFFEEENYASYMIEIHGLKSSMRLLGADMLGDLAERQELAIKESREEFIRETYYEMLEGYYEVVSGIYKTLNIYGCLYKGNILGAKQI